MGRRLTRLTGGAKKTGPFLPSPPRRHSRFEWQTTRKDYPMSSTIQSPARTCIESQPSVCGGRPCVAGTRIRVQDVFVWHELQGQSADEIVSRFPQLTMADVYAALSYYWDHRDEIQREMQAESDLVTRLRQQSVSPLAEKLAATNG